MSNKPKVIGHMQSPFHTGIKLGQFIRAEFIH